MEDRLGAWQKELAELSDNFKMLCRCAAVQIRFILLYNHNIN